MTWMSLRLAVCRSVRLTLLVWISVGLVATPSVGQDVSPYEDPPQASAGDEELIQTHIAKLEKQLAELFPNSKVHVIPLLERLAVRGVAANAEEATRIVQIVEAGAAVFSRYSDGPGKGVREGVIVNMLEVETNDQIVLHIKFATVDRSQLKALAAAAHIYGGQPVGDLSSFATLIADDDTTQRLIEWVQSDESSHIRTIPQLTVQNGHTASIRYPRREGAGIDFSKSLTLLPVVIDGDWLKLEMATEYTRRVASTVKMKPGQTVALSHDFSSDRSSFRSRTSLPRDPERKADDTRVSLCLITPELVRPMDRDVPPLSGFRTSSHNDVRLYNYQTVARPVEQTETILPAARFLEDDVQYFPPGPEFRLPSVPAPPIGKRSQTSRPGLIASPETASSIEPVVAVSDLQTSVEIVEGLSRNVQFKSPVKRVDGFDPEIIEVGALTPRQIRVTAGKPGVTEFVVTDENGTAWTVNVYVKGDARQLQKVIDSQFPDATVEAFKVSDSVVLTGWVANSEERRRVTELAEQFHPRVGISNLSYGGLREYPATHLPGPHYNNGGLFPIPFRETLPAQAAEVTPVPVRPELSRTGRFKISPHTP